MTSTVRVPPRQATCPVCLGDRLRTAVELGDVPVHVGVLWPSEEAARQCPRGEIALTFCEGCGYLFNAAFDEGSVDYGLRYDNALHHSSVFQRYERALAERLIDRYDVRGGDIVEIGCGSAHFLGLLCRMGGNRGRGFDPGHETGDLDPLAKGFVSVERAYFSERHASVPCDLVCARHVLEHVPNPRAFLETLRRVVDDGRTVAYVEVPNALLALADLSIWDLIYEHCAYYTKASISRLFADVGFELIEVAECYGGQFIGVEARSATSPDPLEDARDDLDRLGELVGEFGEQFTAITDHWEEELAELASEGARVVVWGAGAKAVSFMNLLRGAKHVHEVVDINPRKQGTHLAGTGHPIVAPDALVGRVPDIVIVMNPLYVDEIQAYVADLGVRTDVRSV